MIVLIHTDFKLLNEFVSVDTVFIKVLSCDVSMETAMSFDDMYPVRV